MSDSNLENNKSRPWYLGWRGAVAAAGALMVLFILLPSKERTAARQSARIFKLCMQDYGEGLENLSDEAKTATCECFQNTAKEQILEGKPKDDLNGMWFATTSYSCAMRHSVAESELASLDQETVRPGDGVEPQRSQREKQQKQANANRQNSQGPGVVKIAQTKNSRQDDFAPSNPLDAFARIQQGSYLWTRTFPEDELVLFGFGLALRDAFDEQCPGAISTKEAIDIEYFLGGLNGAEVIDVIHGRKSLNIAAILSRAAIDQTLLSAARRRLGELVAAEGCRGRTTRNTATNLARMLSGRRPAYGPGASRTSLVEEKLGPLEPKHAYDNERPAALTSRGAAQLDKDFREVRAGGLTILECHYDKDPNDEWYEVQYYWGVSALANLGYMIPNFGEAFQRAAHERLRKANGRAYTHPFTTYGSPRLECPAFEDPAFDHKRIYAPRKAVPRNAPSVPVPTDPKITEKRALVTYDYGPAPEDFVPPIPDELPSQPLYLLMEKQGAGSLKSIEIHRFGYWSLPRTDMDYRNRPALQEAVREDVIVVSKQKPRVIICKYLAERRGIVNVSRHWYGEAPDGVDRDYLRDRVSDHPILVINGVRETCPAQYEAPT